MMTDTYTPGPWEYVPSNEHHGPYITSDYGGDICDAYTMTDPTKPSIRNGGTSKPIHMLGDQADANMRLAATAPELLEALRAVKARGLPDPYNSHAELIEQVDAAIAKATGQ